MTTVGTSLSTSLDGFIAGADSSPDQPRGAAGDQLFDWLRDGDTPSRYAPPSFKMSAISAQFFDEGVSRVQDAELTTSTRAGAERDRFRVRRCSS
jgi:hypothetical protein